MTIDTKDEMDDPSTAELLQSLDELYPLPDDDRRAERAGRTAAVLQRWVRLQHRELEALIPRIMAEAFAPKGAGPEAPLEATFESQSEVTFACGCRWYTRNNDETWVASRCAQHEGL